MIVNPRPLSAGIPRNLSYGDRSTLLGKHRIPHRLCAYCAHALGGLDLGEELVAEELCEARILIVPHGAGLLAARHSSQSEK